MDGNLLPGAGPRPFPELDKRPFPTTAVGGLPAAKLVEVAYVKTAVMGRARLLLQLARDKRQPHHIVGRKVGGDSAA